MTRFVRRVAHASSVRSATRQAAVVGPPLLVALAGALTLEALGRERAGERAATHAREVLQASDALLLGLVDAETGQRGYLLTGAPRYLAPYRTAEGEAERRLAALAALTRADPAQQARVQTLTRLAGAKFAELRETLALRDSGAPGAALAVVRSDRGRAVMDSARGVLDRLQAAEQTRLAAWQAEGSTRARHTRAAVLVGTLAAVALALLVNALLARTLAEREAANAALGEANTGLRDANLELRTQATALEEQAVELEQQTEPLHDTAAHLEETNEALGRSQATLQSFYDHAPVLMGLVELVAGGGPGGGDDILHLYDNPVTSQFFGAPPGATAYRRATELGVPPAVIRTWAEQYREAERRSAPCAFEYQYDAPAARRAASGGVGETDRPGGRWLAVVVAPVGPGEGGRPRFCYVAQDVTTPKAAEQALEAANRELAATTYTIAHDLRSPLRALDGYSRILQLDHSEQLDDEGRRLLDRIRANSQRMGALIDGVLSLARLGQGGVQRARVDLSALAVEAVAELRRGEPDRAVEVCVEPGLTADGDPRLVALVLQNLLGNAWKFTRGRVPAHVVVGRLAGDAPPPAEDGRTYSTFFVRDDGAGFDPAFAGQLFRPFHRLHHADEYEGHGIGLAGVRRVVERHGGRVWAEGAAGRGATFFFTLPAQPALATPTTAAPGDPSAGRAPDDTRGSTPSGQPGQERRELTTDGEAR